MIKMAGKILILAGMLIMVWIVIWVAPGTYPHDLAALINKRDMLAKAPGKRMIFMGGSSALTLDSPRIQKELGYSVVNMALWGGLGTKQYLEEIKQYIRNGDVVVITQEYATALDPAYINYINNNEESKRFFFILSPSRHTKAYMERREYFQPIKYIFELSQLKVRSFIRKVVTLNINGMLQNGFPNYNTEFNEHGDRMHDFAVFRPLGDTGKKYTYPTKSNHLFLNDFYQYAKNSNVKVLFYFSHFPEEEFLINEPFIREYEKMIRKVLQFQIINTVDDLKLPRALFGDTIYHLNPDGEKVRTDRLIMQLKAIVK